MKLLLNIDQDLFKREDSDYSSHGWLIDLSKYSSLTLSKEVKDILYRPPKVRSLCEKYWELNRQVTNRLSFEQQQLQKGGRNNKGYIKKLPQKNKEEKQLIDKILDTLQSIIDKDAKELDEK